MTRTRKESKESCNNYKAKFLFAALPKNKLCPGVLGLVLFSLHISCQTWKAADPVKLNKNVKEVFSQCSPSEGSLRIKILQPNTIYAELDWVAKSPGDFTIEASSSLGQLLFGIKSQSSYLKTYGPLTSKFPTIQVQDGFYKVNKHMVGIPVKDSGCILMGKIPKRWQQLNSYYRGKTKFKFDLGKSTAYVRFKDPVMTISFVWGGLFGLFESSLKFQVSKATGTVDVLFNGQPIAMWKQIQ